jgi:hypothetical protein
MPSRRNRNGPVTRLLSPVNETAKLAVKTGSRGLRLGNSLWRTVGNGVRGAFRNATMAVNSAGSRLLTGKRHRGGRRNSRKNRSTRKNRKH